VYQVLASIASKCVWQPSFARTRWGSLQRSPRLTSWIWGRGWGKGRIERGRDREKRKGVREKAEGEERDEVG